MNPLLFADWNRMNRVFTRLMWAAAVILVCVICAVLASAGPPAHAASTARPVAAAGNAR